MKVFKEYGLFRLRWDLVISVLLVFSVLIIPFQFAFLHQVDVIGSIVIYSIDFVFLIGILINARTSFRFAGAEVTDVKSIYSKYRKNNFVFDFLAAFPFDIFFLSIDGLDFYGISIVLWLRLIRLIRIRQLFLLVKKWQRHYSINPGYLRITKFFSVIILLSHIIACIWYLSSFFSGFPKKSWAVMEDVNTTDAITQYIRSLYWTITTMTTMGYGDIVPHLNHEYIYNIVVMLIGASTYAFIIGNIASLISSLDSQKSNYWNDLDTLKLYMNQRGVSKSTNVKVQNYYDYRWVHHRGLNEEKLLTNLPDPLRLEVMKELTKDLINQVPLFQNCSEQLKNILVLALQAKTFNPGSYISRTGDSGNEIVFLSRGIIEIVNEDSGSIYSEFKAGEYFGNLSIMLEEKRTAAIRTKGFCEVFVLDSDNFFSIKKDYPEFMLVMKKMSAEKSDKTNHLLIEGIII